MWWNAGFHTKRRVLREREASHQLVDESVREQIVPGSVKSRTLDPNKLPSISRPSLMSMGENPFSSDPPTLAEFKYELRRKFGSVSRAWLQVMDFDGNGRLSFSEFAKALQACGYTGDLKTLWFHLDEDLSGEVTLHELDAVAATSLERFRQACFAKYGNMQRAWRKCLDADNSGTIVSEEFVDACKKMKLPGGRAEALRLFEILDYMKSGGITRDEVEFLQTWEEAKQAAAFRKRLGVAWVNKDPYFHLHDHRNQRPPHEEGEDHTTLDQAKGVELSSPTGGIYLDRSSFITSHLMASRGPDTSAKAATGADPKKQWENFQTFLKTKYGTLPKAFDNMDANGSGSLSCVEFQSVVCGVMHYCRASDAKRLFYTVLDAESQTESNVAARTKKSERGGRGLITWKEFGITPQEWLHHCHLRREEKAHRSRRFAEKSRHDFAVEKHVNALQDPSKARRTLAFGMMPLNCASASREEDVFDLSAIVPR